MERWVNIGVTYVEGGDITFVGGDEYTRGSRGAGGVRGPGDWRESNGSTSEDVDEGSR